MFSNVNTKLSLSARELEVLKFWKEKNIFQKSLEQRQGALPFAFYDGPPFATGLPHYGHLLAGTIKDVVPRYWTMKGRYVERRFGWDCHGLPIENEIEKALNLSGAKSIEQYGIAKFNEECRKIVLRYTNEWQAIVERFGRWVDFSRTWKTMDLSFMESVWWVFGQLWEKGLVYEGFKVMPFSTKLGTPLSNFEASENYKEVDDPSVYVTVALESQPNCSLVIWTTTPWTLLSNLAITASPEIEYVELQLNINGKRYILAEPRVSTLFPNPEEYTIVRRFLGKELEGLSYQPLFPFFEHLKPQGAFKVLLDTFVTLEDGTGLVHTAPGFGEADFYACQKYNIPVVCPVDQNGHFTADVEEFQGKYVKECDKEIIRQLKARGQILKHDVLRHRYPFCWRSDTPLIYKAVSTWFVAVEQIKTTLVESNQQMHWVPGHLKEGRFGKWLENARDWAISRNRYWGTPIPIWRAEDGSLIVIKSLEELQQRTGKKLHDLHRHHIDDVEIHENGKTYRRITEVFDCWFESGSMPYAQNHYPFENQALFENSFPADFVAEGIDQTRAWFYVLTVLAGALFGEPPFKNVIVNGIVLAEDGQKMSKRLRNYPDPLEVVSECGADAVRLYMLASPAVRANDLCFSKAGVEQVVRQVLLPLFNAYSFFITYARIYSWDPAKQATEFQAEIDRWILSKTESLVKEVDEAMQKYELAAAVEPFVQFVDELTNWYIRRSRRRFWEDEATEDRNQAFSTLYNVLKRVIRVAAPFTPFITETMWQNLAASDDPESVHLTDFPQPGGRDIELEASMHALQIAASLGHSVRKEHKLKVRQPLQAAYIITKNEALLRYLRAGAKLLQEELNVREVHFSDNEEEVISYLLKPNFRVLGKKVGKRMKEVQVAIAKLPQASVALLQHGGFLELQLDDDTITLSPEDVTIERIIKEGCVAQNEGEITIALDTHINQELLEEGILREVINKINTMRREMGLHVSDRIEIVLTPTELLQTVVDKGRSLIMSEVLATKLCFDTAVRGQEWDINGEKTTINLSKDVKYSPQ